MRLLKRRSVMVALTATGLSISLTVAGSPAWAVNVDDATTLVQGASERLIDLLNSDMAPAAKRQAFRGIMDDTAAMSDIARVAIGSPWKEMSSSQQASYTDAFAAYLSRSYMDRLSGYQGERLEMRDAEDAGKKGVFVKTVVTQPASGGGDISVEWRVMDRSGPPKVVDIIIEGVSLVFTHRTEFTSLLDSYNGDLDQFITRLQQDADEN